MYLTKSFVNLMYLKLRTLQRPIAARKMFWSFYLKKYFSTWTAGSQIIVQCMLMDYGKILILLVSRSCCRFPMCSNSFGKKVCQWWSLCSSTWSLQGICAKQATKSAKETNEM